MFSRAYKEYVLGALTLLYALNLFDRVLMALLLEPIKQDLKLSDTQLGFLTGIAFALFYSTLGIPIARWADRGNRVTITSLAIGLWGLTVMACLFVTNFVQMMLARVAAAIGEAGCLPPTYSLIGDYFPGPAERSGAMTIYMLASPLASLICFILGGWLNELYGWRVAFFVMGVPALLLAVLVKTTIKEPRLALNHMRTPNTQRPRITDVLRTLWRKAALRHLTIGLFLMYMMGYGLSPWYAAFMVRSHGMHSAELGVWLGLIFGVAGIVGILLGGYLVARWFAQDEAGQMRLSAVALALLVPFFVLFLTLADKHQALISLMLSLVSWSVFLGPTFALMQRLVKDDVRATTLAVIMLLNNLIGMGIGPQCVGTLSDVLMRFVGVDSLRYAMLFMSLIALWAAYHFWQAGRSIKEELATVARDTQLDCDAHDAVAASSASP